MTSLPHTLQDLLRQRAESPRPGSVVIYPLGETNTIPKGVTYTTLHDEAARLARDHVALLKGFRAGRPVLLHLGDYWHTILWFWAVLLAGGLPVLSSPFSNVEEHRHRHIKALSELLQSPICLTRQQLIAEFGRGHGMRLYPIESILGDAADRADENGDDGFKRPSAQSGQNGHTIQPTLYDGAINSDHAERGTDLVMLLLTSGSTGNSKAVKFTQAQVLTAASGKASVRKLPPNQPFLNWIGLDHAASLIEMHIQALFLNVDQIHVSAADIVPSPKLFLDLLSRHGVSRSFAPNFFLAKLVAATAAESTMRETSGNSKSHGKSSIPEDAWDLSNLTVLASGGEMNDVDICVAASSLLARYGAPTNAITPGFGMTETCAGAIFNLKCPDYDVSKQHTVASLGKCMAGIEMRIVTSEGVEATPGEPGYLEVRGAVVSSGYYRNPAATRKAFSPDGAWFRTEDWAVIDQNGNLSLKGRAKDVININSVSMPASDIQATIEKALADRISRLVVFPSVASHTERVTIAYVPKAFPLLDDKAAVIHQLATQASLVATGTKPLVFSLEEGSVPLLPMSTLGKISRHKTARLFEDGVFDKDVELHNEVLARVKSRKRKRERVVEDEVPKNGTSRPKLTMSKAEASLIQDVERTLGENKDRLDIRPDTGIFDVGFTSMHVVQLKHHIEKRIKVHVSIFQIMKNPTIKSLAASLENAQRPPQSIRNGSRDEEQDHDNVLSSYDPVVVLRENGSKTPLWLFHPGVGEVLIFVGLAQQLGIHDDRPVYALRAAGFEPGQPQFSSIDQAVEVYTTAIRQNQPHGPYALAGYSYGSMLAFECAKRLEARGGNVSFLGSLNLPPHIKGRIRQLGWNACLLHLAHFLGLMTEAMSDRLEVDPRFCNMSRAEAIKYTLIMADNSRLGELGLDSSGLMRWVDVAYGLQRLAANYDPSGMVERMDIFHAIPLKAAAESHEVWVRDHLSRWADFVHENPRFHSVGGAHYTMIGGDHVESFAQTLVQALEARGV